MTAGSFTCWHEKGRRSASLRYARLQGFPDDFHFDNKRSSYRLIGNAVPVHMAAWVGEQAMQYFNRQQVF